MRDVRANRSKQAKRSVKKGHKETQDIESAVIGAVSSKSSFGWKDKFELCETLLSKYGGARGEINAMIERAMRVNDRRLANNVK